MSLINNIITANAPAPVRMQGILQTISTNSQIKDLCFVNSAMSPFGKKDFTQCPMFKDSHEMANAFMLTPQISHYNRHNDLGLCTSHFKEILKAEPQLSKNLQKCTQYGLNLFTTPEELHQNSLLSHTLPLNVFKRSEVSNATSLKERCKNVLTGFNDNCSSEKIGNGLVITAISDYNGALKLATGVEIPLLKNYNVFGGTISDGNEMCELLKNANILSGNRMDFLVIKGHGSPSGIQFGDRGFLTKWGMDPISNCIKENLNKDAPIILSSCSTGAELYSCSSFSEECHENNIAEDLSEKTGHRVMAPKYRISALDCDLKVNRKDKSIFSYSCVPIAKMLTHCYDSYESFEKSEGFGKTFHIEPKQKAIPENASSNAYSLVDRIKSFILHLWNGFQVT